MCGISVVCPSGGRHELEFTGSGKDEIGRIASCSHPDYQLPIGKEVVAVDPNYYRPTEVEMLVGDSTKAKVKLGWEPKYDVQSMCSEMVKHDLEIFKRAQVLKEAGYDVKNEFQ